ncbi:MAG: hypothetical protein JW841_09975 [Deltaproteobacteria bacterium]|nr:hypothetical protein [Deltaproteobacteria bacterium]
MSKVIENNQRVNNQNVSYNSTINKPVKSKPPKANGKMSIDALSDSLGGSFKMNTEGILLPNGNFLQAELNIKGKQNITGATTVDTSTSIVFSNNDGGGNKNKFSLGTSYKLRKTYSQLQMEAELQYECEGIKLEAAGAIGRRQIFKTGESEIILQGKTTAKINTIVPIQLDLDISKKGDQWQGNVSAEAKLQGPIIGLPKGDLGKIGVQLSVNEDKKRDPEVTAKVTWSKTF